LYRPTLGRIDRQRALAWLLQTVESRLDGLLRNSSMLIRNYRLSTPQLLIQPLSVLAQRFVAIQRRRLAVLFTDARGAILVEYTILIGTLALAGIIGLIAYAQAYYLPSMLG
jgi:hypothetical protein